MKTSLTIIALIVSNFIFADGIDRIHITKNHPLIFRTNTTDAIQYNITIGDTLIFDAWVDWSTLDKATLEIVSLHHTEVLTQQISNGYTGAKFTYIIRKEDINQPIKFILHYNIKNMNKWHFVTLEKGVFEK